MQILLLTNTYKNSEQFKDILQYSKSLTQNILLVEDSALYEKESFIYAKECMVLQRNEILKDILLSPSLVIDTRTSLDYTQLEGYIKTCWQNTQQAFFQREELISKIKVAKSEEQSSCICYIDNNEAPLFKIIQDSISLAPHLNELTPFNSIGLIEQAITEFFADKNFFSQSEWAIIEVNANADIGFHHFPWERERIDVASSIINSLFPDAKNESKLLEKKSVRLIIKGKVQNVGYRKWLQKQVFLLDIVGWNKNVYSDKVETILTGMPNTIDALIKKCYDGLKSTIVKDIKMRLIYE